MSARVLLVRSQLAHLFGLGLVALDFLDKLLLLRIALATVERRVHPLDGNDTEHGLAPRLLGIEPRLDIRQQVDRLQSLGALGRLEPRVREEFSDRRAVRRVDSETLAHKVASLLRDTGPVLLLPGSASIARIMETVAYGCKLVLTLDDQVHLLGRRASIKRRVAAEQKVAG